MKKEQNNDNSFNTIKAIIFSWVLFLLGVTLVWDIQSFLSIELYHTHPEIYFGVPLGLAIFGFITGKQE